MTAVDLDSELDSELDPGSWRPRPCKRWTRSVLYGSGVRKLGAARYMELREILGLSAGRRAKVSRDLMDRAEWVDVHPDALEHESTLSADDLCDLRHVMDAVGKLSERQRDVLTRRMMGDTLTEVGAHLDRSRERTRQLEREAIWRTRDQIKVDPPTTAVRDWTTRWSSHDP